MRWLVLSGLLLLLFGPLRPWFGRHWAFLTSLVAGGVCGFVLGAMMLTRVGGPDFLPLLWTVVGAAAGANGGPAILRRIQKDGKE